MKFESLSELIGNTPLVRLRGVEKRFGLKFNLFGKLESFNPLGSVKDRLALALVKDAIDKGLLSVKSEENYGRIWVEATSGNTGIGLAFLARLFGFRLIVTMPETMSEERRLLLAYLGAEVVLTSKDKGMTGATEAAKEICSLKRAYIPGQFENPANPKFHYETTGPEIWRQSGGEVDAFIAGYGTGGTVSGAGRYLKEKNPDCFVITVEPEESPVLSKGVSGSHRIQGIGPGFVPKTLDISVIDRVVTVSYEEAKAASKTLNEADGLLAGISSGANVYAAVKMKDELKGKNVVVVIPDTGERYLSTDLFRNNDVQERILTYEDWRKKHGLPSS